MQTRIKPGMWIAGFVSLVVGVSTAAAQTGTPSSGAFTESTALAARDHVYRLDFESSYETDTGPCDIPSEFSELIRGTAGLSNLGFNNAGFRLFALRDVNWLLTVGDRETRISGHGLLEFGGGLGPLPMARLTLTLRWDDERGVRFDSGYVPVQPTMVPSFDLTVREIDGDICWTRILRIAASVVPRAEMIPYRLRESSVTQQVSPTGPSIWRPLGGHFRAIVLPPEDTMNPAVHELALVSVAWHAPASALADWPLRVRGAGIYRYGSFGPDPVVEHRLEADLVLIDGPTFTAVQRLRFDSGLQLYNNASWWPTPIIDIELPQLDDVWPMTSFDLRALPLNNTPATP